MISPEDVYFSSATIDNDLPSPSPYHPKSSGPLDFLDDFLVEFNLLDPDRTDIPLFDDNKLDNFLNENIEGFDQAQARIFDGELPNLLEQCTLSSNEQSITNECQVMETKRNDSIVIKTSDLNMHSDFISSTRLCQTGESLKLITPPDSYQRARYEKELDEDLRYVSTPGDNGIELQIPDLRSRMSMNQSLIMRIARNTIPYGPDEIVFCHPYSLWMKDEHAKVHHGSVVSPITNQQMEDQSIKIKNLLMPRLKQDTLKKITQWPIYTTDQLDCNGYYSISTTKPKATIEHYNLRYSVLRFQVFLIDENQIAYPTDLSCETTPIYEYEDKERQDLRAIFGTERKRQTKRLQQKSNMIKQKNTQKNTKQIKRKRLTGLIRTKNAEYI